MTEVGRVTINKILTLKNTLQVTHRSTFKGVVEVWKRLVAKGDLICEKKVAIGKNTPELSLDIEVTDRYDGIQVKKKGASTYAFKAASDNGGGYINLLDKDGVHQFGLDANTKRMIVGTQELTEKQLRIMKVVSRPIWHLSTFEKFPQGLRFFVYYNTKIYTTIKLKEKELPTTNFEIEKIKEDVYAIRHVITDAYLTADGQGKGTISLAKTKISISQHMSLIANENGSFYIKNIHSGFYLSRSNFSLAMSTRSTPWNFYPGELDLHTFLRVL